MTKPIISFIILLISLGFSFLYVKPAYELVQERQKDVVSLSAILNNSSKIKTLIEQTTENLDSINTTEAARFAVFLPEKIDSIRFANNIQHIGYANEIILNDISVKTASEYKQVGQAEVASNHTLAQGVKNIFSMDNKAQQAQGASGDSQDGATNGEKKRYATTKATFNFISTYESFLLLLNDLEKSLGLINITSLSFSLLSSPSSTNKINTSQPIYQFAVAIETYSLK